MAPKKDDDNNNPPAGEGRNVLCPECDTQVNLDEVDECPKCGLDVEKVYQRVRYEDAVAKVRKQREVPQPKKKAKKDFNPFD